MLLELKVKDFAIINSVEIGFKPGLNVLSGETGAGKSVLLKSLALLMGEKALADTVRTGASNAVIEGFFDLGHRPDVSQHLEAMGIDTADDVLVVRRVIQSHGKSRVYLNGHLSALNNLKDIVAPLIEVTGQAAPLIEMTGQHDNRHLQSRAYHLDVLDDYTNSWPLRQKFSDAYKQLNDLEDKIESISQDTRERAQRLDFLTYQRDEIAALGLKPGDEDELENTVKRLRNSSQLEVFAAAAEDALYGDDDSALVRLHQVIQQAADFQRVDPGLAAKAEPLAQAKALIEDFVYEIRDYGRQLEASPDELQDYEEKLSQLRKLQKKYGESVADILKMLSSIEDEINQLELSDESLEQLKKQHKGLSKEVARLAEELHARRKNGSDLLAKSINDELKDLNMKGLTFLIEVRSDEHMTSTGQSLVEFMTKTSKQDTPRPLAKFASGGELSRILLSIKRVVGLSTQPRTYLFDEVDAGVSGLTAEKVGRKLKSIAQGQQVICVTHLPQVAAFADAHYLIQKNTQGQGVNMEVSELTKGKRVDEIARLISGEKITKTSLDHAKALLQEVQP